MPEGNGLDSDFVLGSIHNLQKCVENLDEQGAIEILMTLVPEATIDNHLNKKEQKEKEAGNIRHLELRKSTKSNMTPTNLSI